MSLTKVCIECGQNIDIPYPLTCAFCEAPICLQCSMNNEDEDVLLCFKCKPEPVKSNTCINHPSRIGVDCEKCKQSVCEWCMMQHLPCYKCLIHDCNKVQEHSPCSGCKQKYCFMHKSKSMHKCIEMFCTTCRTITRIEPNMQTCDLRDCTIPICKDKRLTTVFCCWHQKLISGGHTRLCKHCLRIFICVPRFHWYKHWQQCCGFCNRTIKHFALILILKQIPKSLVKYILYKL